MKDRCRGVVFLAGALLPLLPAGVAYLYSILPLTLRRVTVYVDLRSWLGPWAGGAVVLLGLVSLALLAMAVRMQCNADRITAGLLVGIMALELAALSALLYSFPLGGPGPGLPLFRVLLVERGVWLALAGGLVVVLPLSALLFYATPPREEAGLKGGSSQAALLAAALLVSALSVFLPHTALLNPEGYVVSTDARFNAEWIGVFEEKGLVRGLVELAPRLRPLYMIFLYVVHRALCVDPLVLADIYLPGLGLALLSLTVYYVERGSGGRPGLAALLSILYWAPMFVYGGFQTNLYSLSLALLYAYTVWRGLRWATVLGAVLGLWHPWTLAYYTVAVLALLVVRWGRSAARYAVAALVVPWVVTVVVNLALLGEAGLLAATVSPVVPGHDPFFTIYEYMWGTLARPEILFAAAYVLVLGRSGWAGWFTAPGFLFFPLLSPVAGFRVLMQAPAPLLASRVPGRWVWGVLAVSLSSWFFLVLSCVPG